ncbi:MAG TPA: calcium-binding protein, partial [Frankiaceae bacterium]|nr:calcium-binding protein [Frankiaceae bacterium]
DDGEPGEGDDVAGPYYEVVGGAGADELHGSGSFARIDGGPGDDRIVGTPGQDALGGGDGDDAIDAGDGTDLLTGGTGADVLRGGEGHDTVRYRATAEPLTVALDDAGGDGAPGEGDDVRGDVEDVDAGETRGDNVLIGSGAANLLQGGDGDDRLEGGAGDDTLRADDGANSLVGGPGVDLLDAYDFSSRRVADDIDARDGERDRIACGANGADRLLADPEDAAFGCAPVVVPAWAKYVRVTRRGVARLRVRCPATATAPCTGRLSLFGEAFIPRAGKGDFRGIAPGRIAAVGVRLTTATRRRLARVRTLQFDITALARRTRPKSTGEGYFRVRLLRHR